MGFVDAEYRAKESKTLKKIVNGYIEISTVVVISGGGGGLRRRIIFFYIVLRLRLIVLHTVRL